MGIMNPNNRPKPNRDKSRNARPVGRTSPKQGKQAKVSKLDPRLLVKTASPSSKTDFKSETTFSDLPIGAPLKKNLTLKGYTTLTKIQDQSLLPLLEKRDLMGISNTGSGKTCAFLIPIIEHALANPHDFKALIVTPTRELALQIEEGFKSLTKGMNLSLPPSLEVQILILTKNPCIDIRRLLWVLLEDCWIYMAEDYSSSTWSKHSSWMSLTECWIWVS